MGKGPKKLFKNLGFITRVLYNASLPLSLLLVLMSVAGGLMMAVELWAITNFINQVLDFNQWSGSFVDVFLHFSPYIGAFLGAILLNNVVGSLQPYVSAKLNERVSIYLNNQMFDKSMNLELEALERPDYYNKLELSTGIVQGELVYTLEMSGQALGLIVQLAIIILAVSDVGIFYGLLLLITCIPLFYANIKASENFAKVNYGQSETRRRQGYWNGVATSREMAAEVRLLQLGTFIFSRWKTETKKLISELMKARTQYAIQTFKGEIFYLMLLFTMMGATIYEGLQGEISLGAVVAILYLLDRLEGVINLSSELLEGLGQFYFRFQVVPEFLGLDEEEKSVGITAPDRFEKEICFDNVSFKYPGQSGYALKNVSFTIQPGERLAIVGENGAGKSTLCLLLLGLYRPTAGKVTVDGIDLSDIDLKTWRKTAASVFQNYVKYQLTVTENIGFGNVDEISNSEKIKSAAKKGGIHNVVEKLTHKYQTLLGKQYEESHDLSGGEWQKVAVSRAYFRDAELLVLDEPVSALDAHAEYEVYKQFSDMSVGKTVIIVSHRLGSAKLANKILFFQDGQLTEEGSHDELIQSDGEYASLFRMQAEWYAEETKEEAIK